MIKIKRNLSDDCTKIILIRNIKQLTSFPDLWKNNKTLLSNWENIAQKPCDFHFLPSENLFIVRLDIAETNLLKVDYNYGKSIDTIRICGGNIFSEIKKHKLSFIGIENLTNESEFLHAFVEGMSLANYSFDKYLTTKPNISTLKEIQVLKGQALPSKIEQIIAISDAVKFARDLVNEPPNILTAEELSKRIKNNAKESGIRCQIYDKAKIEQLKMGGLLAVNRGSQSPPTFTILEHKPANAINSQPIVLVGKGVVYDTGGLSLKPTANSMDKMKSDMAGAAIVAGILSVVGKLDLPIHIIGLIPATDNRPGYDAYTPGDIITMHSGQTVEVLNTDAEGRMILADAIHFAKRYTPLWIGDFATLTGAAAAAIGPNAMVSMGNISQELMNEFITHGYITNEKIAQMPFWDEYSDYLKSSVADMKNIGGPYAGAITAGKFLEKFTSYPFVHFDIAGVSFSDKHSEYIPSGGTGFGIRMMSNYLINTSKK